MDARSAPRLTRATGRADLHVHSSALIELNPDYRTKRRGDVGMLPPRVVALAPGSFHRWMRAAGKLGDQHKVPRATNDRAVADALLTAAAAAGERDPVVG